MVRASCGSGRPPRDRPTRQTAADLLTGPPGRDREPASRLRRVADGNGCGWHIRRGPAASKSRSTCSRIRPRREMDEPVRVSAIPASHWAEHCSMPGEPAGQPPGWPGRGDRTAAGQPGAATRGLLITQRSQVQILPRYQAKRVRDHRSWGRFLLLATKLWSQPPGHSGAVVAHLKEPAKRGRDPEQLSAPPEDRGPDSSDVGGQDPVSV